MALPYVKIKFANGSLGSTTPSEDGITGLIATAEAVAVTFELNKAYLITSLSALEKLGITKLSTGANANIYKAVSDFYNEAPEGSKLWIMGVADTVTLSNMFDKSNADYAKKLIQAANGNINILVAKKTDAAGYEAELENGLDSDVYTAMGKAQELAEWATDSLYAPLFTIIEGRHYTGIPADLADLSKYDNNRVSIVIGDTKASSNGAAVGLFAGRVATIPVQRSAARVKDGVIKADDMFIGDDVAENGEPALIHDAGFICPRTFVGKAGYFWSDDKLATATTDDYALIPRRRTVDKAYRIAYKTLIEELNDEIPVTSNGYMPAPTAKSIQNNVEVAILNNMDGELGADPSDSTDSGVECFIDPEQNIVSTSKLSVSLRVRPFAYAKCIDVELGFTTVE